MLDILPVIAAAPSGAEAGGLSGLPGQFGIEWKLIIAQMINFVIVAFLLWKFAFKPVMNTIHERQEKIASGLQYADEMKQKLAEAEKQQQETLREAQQEAQRVLADARNQAKEHLDRQTAEASAKVEAMLERGREANELERQKMLSEVRKEVARLVVLTSEKVLRKELSESEKSRLNESAAKEVAGQN